METILGIKVFNMVKIAIFAALNLLSIKLQNYIYLFMKKLLFIASMIVLLTACGGQKNDKSARLTELKKQREQISEEISKLEKELGPADSIQLTHVKVDLLAPKLFEHYIEVQGRIDGNENIGVSPRNQGGVVTKILVKEGDQVKEGQVLAELDAVVLKQQLTDLKNKLSFVTDIYNRQKSLWDQKIGSEVQYLKAKNDMESVQYSIEDIPIKVGQMASSASPTPAFRIVNFTKAKALADVGEAYTSKVKTGDQVKIFMPDINEELTERVTFASKFINPTNRTFLVEVALPDPKFSLRANMIAVLRINDYSNPAALSVPQNYIQKSPDEGSFVFVGVEENGKKIARKKIITPGVTYNGLTEITAGLTVGDMIITAGYKDLYNGQLIDF